MTPEQLAERHPRLYHVTAPGAWEGIKRHGLLPTSRLLDLFEVPAAERALIEGARRPASLPVAHPVHGVATITDNAPLNMKCLAACLDDGLTPADWLRRLNERVFFWADERGLARLLGARLNRGRARDVLVVDTRSLARAHHARVELSAINSGAALRRAARRGLHTFTPMGAHSYEAWRRLRGKLDRVLEVTVVGGCRDIADHVVAVRRVTPPADRTPAAARRPAGSPRSR